MSNEIIVANSGSYHETTALSIIRISGDFNPSLLDPFFSLSLEKINPRYQYLCHFSFQGKIFDELLFSFFLAPKSFTGENMIELTVHGNPLNVERMIDVLVENSPLKRALPGEFSLRAYRNKKMTLPQAEGLWELLQAKSTSMLDLSVRSLLGEAYDSYIDLKKKYLELRAIVELNIDFSEDVGEASGRELLVEKFKNYAEKVKALSERAQFNPSIFKDPSIVLVGKTNAGKSTLFNHLLGHPRSITSAEEGTTRDYVSETLVTPEATFRLIDTAGIRPQGGQIEREGMERGLSLYEKAFFKILVVNPALGEDLREGDLKIVTHQESSFFEGDRFFVNALDPTLPLREKVLEKVHRKWEDLIKTRPIISERQRDLLRILHEKSQRISSLIQGPDLGILSHEVNSFSSEIDELLGETSSQEVLDHLFSQFCIGK